MKINWIQQGIEVTPGYEDAVMELEYFPGIPMSVIFGNPLPQTPQDAEERRWLLKESEKAITEINKGQWTRRAMFFDNYEGCLKINCYGLFHFKLDPDERLNLFVYMRSTNLKNLGYDLITIDKIYDKVWKETKTGKYSLKAGKGKVTIHFASLHYYKDEIQEVGN